MKMNRDKTSLFFSRNTKLASKNYLMQAAGLQASTNLDKYLGLPSLIGKSRTHAFWMILDKVVQKLGNWKNKFLSQAGKEILIKAILQSIPTYCISVFILPKSLCSQLNKSFAKFWWGHLDNHSRLHWRNRSTLYLSKQSGGMGFRYLHFFNLAKQAWLFLVDPTSLPSIIFQEKYFPTSSILNAELGSKPSYIWRSIFQALPLFKEGLLWKIGNGEKVEIWTDPWLPANTFGKVQSPISIISAFAYVFELLDRHTGWWRMDLVKSIYVESDARQILNIPTSNTSQQDTLIWR